EPVLPPEPDPFVPPLPFAPPAPAPLPPVPRDDPPEPVSPPPSVGDEHPPTTTTAKVTKRSAFIIRSPERIVRAFSKPTRQIGVGGSGFSSKRSARAS